MEITMSLAEAIATRTTNVLTPDQVAFYHEHGYLRIEQVFARPEIDELSDQLDWIIATWAGTDKGWTGPWRRAYMDEATEKKSKLTAMHDLQYYSAAWARAVINPKLCGAMADLLDGGPVEFHHSTLHVKPPQTGHPFPLHQDWAFYKHADHRYIDVLVHLDDTSHANGEIRFLAGSHKGGALEHVTRDPQTGAACSPHLPVDQYRLADTVAAPAKRGDVVVFNIHTIHGSHINTTDRMRRMVRVGYRHPENVQLEGQSKGRPGWIVFGQRSRRDAQALFPTE
jgi:ectoine hydroxylase-related dioxygenase (phytanoyl-CoA dioxygenase family)